MMRTYNSSRTAAAKSSSILTHCVPANLSVGRFIRRAEGAVPRNFGRTLGVALVVSLLATSSPTAAPTVVAFAKDSERSAASWLRNNELSAKFYRGLAYGYGRYRNWTAKLAFERAAKPGPPPDAAGVVAFMSPAVLVIDAPTNLGVTSASNTAVGLSWSAPAGTVNYYQIERSQSQLGPFPVIGTAVTTVFSDTTVTSGSAYLYRVRAVSSGGPSPPSNMAVGTAISFTDDPLVVGVTPVKAQHVTELRQSVNAVRSVAGLASASWTDTSLPGTFIKAVHVQELRDWLGEALAALSVPAPSYTDPVLNTGVNGTLVKKAHIEELRQRASRSSSTSSGSVAGDLSNARLDPLNRTGGGDDPLSRNFNWSVPLVGLPGRSGLDLGLSLSYNSLVWTKSGSFISFDDDRGFPSPGFRLGFPVIQSVYFNSEVGKLAYLLIAPDGSRVELRQVGTSALYEAADSSHLLLDSNTMILRSTDGTQFTYDWKGSDFQCTEIKDRNGNFITVNYTAFGRIDTVVDTLSRTIKLNYDGNNYLTSITQTWTVNGAPEIHNWATFTYSDPNLPIQTNFSGLTVVGPQNGSTLKVLTRVTLADNSRFDFDYTSWGQVWKVSNFAADNHLLNYRAYNLRGSPLLPSGTEADCPRFTERRDWAENWNRGGALGAANLPVGPEQEVVTGYAVPVSASWSLPDTTQQTGLRAQVTLPDNTYQKIHFAGTSGTSSGWQRGLLTLVETYDSANIRQKQAVTTWTQDNTSVSYPLNPRVTETNIHDPAGNRARITVSYGTFNFGDGTTCRLLQDVYEYQANASKVLRRTHTDYNLATTYTDRRIIGLVSEKTLHQVDPNTQVETLMSKAGFLYDESGSILGADAPVQHDNTNYSASFVAGRANLSSVKRYDVLNIAQFVTSSSKYNTAGAAVSATDPLNHQVTISYAESFSDGNNSRNTLAYPTSVTDADGFFSSSQYNFDFGAVTRTQTPPPAGQSVGAIKHFTFDSIGRIQKVAVEFNGNANYSYRRFEYPSSQTRVDTYATIQEGMGEAHSFKISDGHGRVFATAADHPGSMEGFSGQLVLYDLMGRVVKQSNPTETDASGTALQWIAAGDDEGAGWLYSQQTYDWQGRTLLTTNTDGTTKEVSYSSCGCAGGSVVTLTDEGTLDGGVPKRRQQKIYSDVLGRMVKTEVLNWEGGSVYSATVNTYNARDQITQVRQYAGAATTDGSCPSGTCQETTMTHDGHFRLKTRHVPEQNAGTATSWDYNADDTIQKVTDARGATQTFGYNNRDFVTGITYAWPGGGTVPNPVDFSYDAAGNRTSMSDGTGSMSYAYDQLSRLTSETRTFDGVSGSYTLSYQYNLGSQLKKITDHTNVTINYDYDAKGRTTGVTGENNLHAGVSAYASNLQYRAWDALKHLQYDNSLTLDQQFNSRLQITAFQIPGLMSKAYAYYADGRVRQSFNDSTSNKFDRSYTYDHGGRVTNAASGPAARGEADTTNRPYLQSYGYDVFSHLTSRTGLWWSFIGGQMSAQQYQNNRNVAWSYDADGRLTNDVNVQYTYDAAGRAIQVVSTSDLTQSFDGDGERAKSVEVRQVDNGDGTFTPVTTIRYYLRSTVLRQVVTELNELGLKQRGFVYLGSAMLAWQHKWTIPRQWFGNTGTPVMRASESLRLLDSKTPTAPRSWTQLEQIEK